MKKSCLIGGLGPRAQIPFLSNNALGRQSQDIEASISYKTEVLRGSYSDSRVKEWGVFNCVAIEALSAIFEHGWLQAKACICTS